MPEEYFGNLVQIVTATTKAGELIERGPGWGAWLLNQVIASHSDAILHSSVQSWIKKPEFQSSHKLASNSLITGSSPRSNAYGNDFGWGRPVALHTGCANRFDGKMMAFPGPVKGSVDIAACLFSKDLEENGR